MNTKTPSHEIIVNRNGTTSLREISSGEVMHSSVGPFEEATLLYIQQSALAERLTTDLARGPLVLWDVGLGAGTNALAALQCLREAAKKSLVRPIHVVSFETDVSGMELAFANKDKFPFFDGLETGVATLLATDQWKSEDGLITWDLHRGDFLGNIDKCPAPEIIFFDLYSPKSMPHLWKVEMFERVRAKCQSTAIYTFSASTRVRSALLMAGFYVGYGCSTGAKVETTVAATELKLLSRPLDARWVERFKRSHAAIPYCWPEEQTSVVTEKVLSHPQLHT